MRNFIKHCLIISLCALSLQGCVFFAGAAAGAAGIAIVRDQRGIKGAMQDTNARHQILSKINEIPDLKKKSHIEVAVFNNVALLVGQTPNPEWRERAGEIAGETTNINRVYNRITIQGPTSSLTRTSDVWITTKIKSEMITTENLRSGSIKVVTENGVVYLMGALTHKQADIAVEIARKVSGVQKVVKVFRYKK